MAIKYLSSEEELKAKEQMMVIRISCGKPTGKAQRDGCVYVDAVTGNVWKWKRGRWIRDRRYDYLTI